MTSLAIKSNIPKRKPATTRLVWAPSQVASRITSLHQKPIVPKTNRSPICKITQPRICWCIYMTPPIVSIAALHAPNIGHGLTETKWYQCFCFFPKARLVLLRKATPSWYLYLNFFRPSQLGVKIWDDCIPYQYAIGIGRVCKIHEYIQSRNKTPMDTGKSNVQPRYINWSYLYLGNVARTQIKL